LALPTSEQVGKKANLVLRLTKEKQLTFIEKNLDPKDARRLPKLISDFMHFQGHAP
jgi:uncharacterized protein with NRDE domain